MMSKIGFTTPYSIPFRAKWDSNSFNILKNEVFNGQEMHRVRKPEFKRQHPDLHGQQLEEEWKKFKKNQELYLFNEYHGLTNDHPLDKVTGFKSKKKNEYLAIEPKHRKIIPGDYKLKDNKKRFICHLFYPDGTYFMDIMFTGDLSYLLFLNFHTSYWSSSFACSYFT